MTPHTHVIQAPGFPAAQLILLFHDAHGDVQSMCPMGERLASEFPQATVVAVAAHEPSEVQQGWQWFSTDGLSDENHAQRVSAALPIFEACVRYWQRAAGVAPNATALIGFAQGATMVLESTQSAQPLAARVIAMSGRFATLPSSASDEITMHLLHGKLDPVTPYSHTVTAAHQLRDLGADITAEVLPFIGHEIHPKFIDLVVRQLTTHVPKRIWADAMKDSPRLC